MAPNHNDINNESNDKNIVRMKRIIKRKRERDVLSSSSPSILPSPPTSSSSTSSLVVVIPPSKKRRTKIKTIKIKPTKIPKPSQILATNIATIKNKTKNNEMIQKVNFWDTMNKPSPISIRPTPIKQQEQIREKDQNKQYHHHQQQQQQKQKQQQQQRQKQYPPSYQSNSLQQQQQSETTSQEILQSPIVSRMSAQCNINNNPILQENKLHYRQRYLPLTTQHQHPQQEQEQEQEKKKKQQQQQQQQENNHQKYGRRELWQRMNHKKIKHLDLNLSTNSNNNNNPAVVAEPEPEPYAGLEKKLLYQNNQTTKRLITIRIIILSFINTLLFTFIFLGSILYVHDYDLNLDQERLSSKHEYVYFQNMNMMNTIKRMERMEYIENRKEMERMEEMVRLKQQSLRTTVIMTMTMTTMNMNWEDEKRQWIDGSINNIDDKEKKKNTFYTIATNTTDIIDATDDTKGVFIDDIGNENGKCWERRVKIFTKGEGGRGEYKNNDINSALNSAVSKDALALASSVAAKDTLSEENRILSQQIQDTISERNIMLTNITKQHDDELNTYNERLLALEFTETDLLSQIETITTQLNDKIKEDEILRQETLNQQIHMKQLRLRMDNKVGSNVRILRRHVKHLGRKRRSYVSMLFNQKQYASILEHKIVDQKSMIQRERDSAVRALNAVAVSAALGKAERVEEEREVTRWKLGMLEKESVKALNTVASVRR